MVSILELVEIYVETMGLFYQEFLVFTWSFGVTIWKAYKSRRYHGNGNQSYFASSINAIALHHRVNTGYRESGNE